MIESHAMPFQLVSKYKPRGDQPQAIKALTESLRAGNRYQTLLGVTGSGKTFTMANVIQQLDRPTLVISHNKTLAAQLFSEFKQFFPHNAVEYFVSYYDYYQPEAYIPQTDTYIEKDASINEQIERLRLSTTSSLLSRRDVIVVASVSCIYGLGSPEDYFEMMALVSVGSEMSRDDLLRKLVDMQYNRNDIEFTRGNFRVRGDTVEVCPGYTEEAVRIEFVGDRIERITRFDPLTGNKREEVEHGLHLSRPSIGSRRTTRLPAPLSRSKPNSRSASPGSSRRANCSKRSACTRARCTTWRCSRKWGSARASRTTRATSAGARRANARSRCWISSRRITCWSSTNRTSPSRRSAACTPATARARRRSSNTVSACRRRWTIARSTSRSSRA